MRLEQRRGNAAAEDPKSGAWLRGKAARARRRFPRIQPGPGDKPTTSIPHSGGDRELAGGLANAMRMDTTSFRDPNRYCEYHKDTGHTTGECLNLVKVLVETSFCLTGPPSEASDKRKCGHDRVVSDLRGARPNKDNQVHGRGLHIEL